MNCDQKHFDYESCAGDGGGPVIDLRQILERLGDDEQLLADLVVLYFEDAPQLLEQIRAALVKPDFSAAQHAAHTFKGLAANFSASQAVAAGQLVESAAARRDLGSARAALAPLSEASHRLDDALRQLQSRR